jgi:hypothetical protein
LRRRVARFFLVNIPKREKYTNWPQNLLNGPEIKWP